MAIICLENAEGKMKRFRSGTDLMPYDRIDVDDQGLAFVFRHGSSMKLIGTDKCEIVNGQVIFFCSDMDIQLAFQDKDQTEGSDPAGIAAELGSGIDTDGIHHNPPASFEPSLPVNYNKYHLKMEES